jgi:hypothetical protein
MDWVVVLAGARFLRTSAHISRNAERVEPTSLAKLSAIMSGRNHKQRTRIIFRGFITQLLKYLILGGVLLSLKTLDVSRTFEKEYFEKTL